MGGIRGRSCCGPGARKAPRARVLGRGLRDRTRPSGQETGQGRFRWKGQPAGPCWLESLRGSHCPARHERGVPCTVTLSDTCGLAVQPLVGPGKSWKGRMRGPGWGVRGSWRTERERSVPRGRVSRASGGSGLEGREGTGVTRGSEGNSSVTGVITFCWVLFGSADPSFPACDVQSIYLHP